jgi:hypothetical protein
MILVFLNIKLLGTCTDTGKCLQVYSLEWSHIEMLLAKWYHISIFSSVNVHFLGMLKHTTEGYVMKPVQNDERGKKEIEFYEDVFLSANACSVITHLRDLVPRYLGLHQFISDDSGKINVVCFIIYFLIIVLFSQLLY